MYTKIKSPLWIIVIGCAFYITVALIYSEKYQIPALVAILIFDLIIILSTMVPKATDAECKKYEKWMDEEKESDTSDTAFCHGAAIAKFTVIWVSSKNVFKCPKI